VVLLAQQLHQEQLLLTVTTELLVEQHLLEHSFMPTVVLMV
jgi:hypothetical protein